MAKQRPKQRAIVERVMHEFKQGHLDSSSGQAVENPRQAIAIALHEAGVSRDETSAGNRRDQARTEALERHAGKGRQGGGKTCAALQAEAAKRGIRGRSRTSKAQLAEVLVVGSWSVPGAEAVEPSMRPEDRVHFAKRFLL